MPASPARRTAFEILRRVASEQAFASDLLHAKLRTEEDRADAALATEITLGVLRWQRLLDFLLQRHVDRPIARLDVEVLLALRIGLYQMRFLDRVPTHAAVNESVKLAKGARKRSAGPLVNAVLRRAACEAKLPEKELESLLAPEGAAAARMGIAHSHPTWMVERWLASFGEARTLALLQANNRPPRLCCAVADGGQVQSVSESLRNQGFEVRAGRWLRTAVEIAGGNPSTADAFLQGRISVQDEASQIVAHLVDARPGEVVLDICAAPGGKTGILARAVAPDGRVIATDLRVHRLRNAREQMTRTHTEGVCWLALDATQPLPFAGGFTRILLDAPCSGTGTLARNPEIKWRLQPDDLARAHDQQTVMLKEALAKLASGGRMVYATCSLEPDENEQTVREAILQTAGVRVAAGRGVLQPWLRAGASAAELFDAETFFRTFPPESGTDGFFAAVLERSA
jgi:16S rRNA (cytosine967-C5)-methyltransferase